MPDLFQPTGLLLLEVSGRRRAGSPEQKQSQVADRRRLDRMGLPVSRENRRRIHPVQW